MTNITHQNNATTPTASRRMLLGEMDTATLTDVA